MKAVRSGNISTTPLCVWLCQCYLLIWLNRHVKILNDWLKPVADLHGLIRSEEELRGGYVRTLYNSYTEKGATPRNSWIKFSSKWSYHFFSSPKAINPVKPAGFMFSVQEYYFQPTDYVSVFLYSINYI
jgi:hypothetical protein